MSDFHLVDPQGWEYDLQSVYSAYMGYFQLHNVPWHDRSWGHLFDTFEQFLTFSWPVITVTDAQTGRAHIVTRLTSIGAFLKMIRTRFGETLPQIDNMLCVTPSESSHRHLRKVNDWISYKKLHATLPAVALAAFRARVRAGDPSAARTLWAGRDKTFMAVGFTWSERNNQSCLEWGYAAVRCGHLDALRAWPPVPETNYRKGHYIVAEYADKVVNRVNPNYPWQYAFGESQVIPKGKLPRIIQSVFSSLLSPDVETSANNLILVGHGVHADIQRLEEMKIKLPHNLLVIDTTALERSLSGAPPPQQQQSSSKHSTPRASLAALLCALGIQPQCMLNNAGNDAFMGLYAFQRMIDPDSAVLPVPTAIPTSTAARMSSVHMGVPGVVHPALSPRISGMPGMPGMGMGGMYAPAPSIPMHMRGLHLPHGIGMGTIGAGAGATGANGASEMGMLIADIAGERAGGRGEGGDGSPPALGSMRGSGRRGGIHNHDRDGGKSVDELGRRGTGKGMSVGTQDKRGRVSGSSSGSGSGTHTSASASTSTSPNTDTDTSNTNTNSNGTGASTGTGGKKGLRRVAMALRAATK
ncbi:hypothetical protein J3A83DRAFT_4241379 [Scleroderma citrinum]